MQNDDITCHSFTCHYCNYKCARAVTSAHVVTHITFALCAPVASPDADAIFISDADAIFISDADAIFVSDADAIFISDADAIFVSDAASYASALCAPVTNPECAANF